MATVTAHRELTVSSPWPKWSQPAVTETWPGPWLSCDLAANWAVIILKMPWLSCDLAVTELWPHRDWAVTSPSRDWAVIIGPWSRDHCGHRQLTVSSLWPFIFSWDKAKCSHKSKDWQDYRSHKKATVPAIRMLSLEIGQQHALNVRSGIQGHKTMAFF